MNVYSWYTRNTPYETLAAGFSDNCRYAGIEPRLLAVDPFKDWDEACSYKATLIRKMMDINTAGFWFLDIDCAVLSMPEGFTADFGAHFYRDQEPQGSALWINPTPATRKLVDLWIEANKKHAGVYGDQLCLMMALSKVPELQVERLCPAYCWIDKLSEKFYKRPDRVVFYQTQASRRFKKTVGGGVAQVSVFQGGFDASKVE